MKELIQLQEMSNRYGSDSKYVLAGGGNTSYKTEDTLYVKGSGTSLATIKAEDFVNMDRRSLSSMWDTVYPENETERERVVLADMMNARKDGESRRPSVETLLHDLFPQKFVLHVHPALVNGMTCGKNGKETAAELFPECIWVDACRPGYILASLCRSMLLEYKAEKGRDADLLFLQNHGVFFAADTVEAIDLLVARVMDTISSYAEKQTVIRREALCSLLNKLTETKQSEFLDCPQTASFDPDENSPTPDHIVYCKANYMTVKAGMSESELEAETAEFKNTNGYFPRVVIVKGEGAVVLGTDEKQLKTVKDVFLDQVKVYHASRAFGGYCGMSDDLVDFIVNWEVESYRSRVSSS